MSFWTYINGTITVEPMGRTQAEKRYILETILNHLPLVTGSEKDMNVYIIQKNGANSFSSCDEYGEHTNNLVDRYGCHDYKTGWLDVQREYMGKSFYLGGGKTGMARRLSMDEPSLTLTSDMFSPPLRLYFIRGNGY